MNSPTAASPSMPAECGLPAPQNVAVAAPPATTTPEPSPTEAAAEVPADTSHTPAPIVKPAPIRRTDPEPPVRTRSAPPGPTVSNQASPAVAQTAADTSNSPTAVATGIELVQPGSEASGSSNQPLPVVTSNPVRPASPAGQPQMSTAGIPGLPIASNNPSQPPASAPLRSAGPLAIFQSQAAPPANVVRNPFVDEAPGDAKKVALVSDNQSLPGDSAATAATTQLANWQVDAARPNQAAAPPAVAAPQARVSDDQLLAYYRQNAGNYQGPAEVRWVWIRVRFNSYGAKPDTYAAAAALRQAAVEDQLAEAVRKYPQTEVLRFTWTPADRLPSKSIAKALLRMRAGEVSVMLESASGVEVVQLLDARSTTLSFEQAREQVQQDLLNSSRR
ncbi:MAG TPA: peptidyl-prolyl cis-trans isomerase [Pirellulales bacterium]